MRTELKVGKRAGHVSRKAAIASATGAQQLDYTLVLGTTLFYGLLLVLVNLVVDVLYAIIDPRVRLE
jgi:ABC-type microcin C transport system permease subunit YejB